ncbi:MAG TPA: EamA family transporter [Cytophagales bacterium]|nr:EamA family transporter [Cytophagales bacterium]HAA19295.1 EamA family transporter [Cytophagales bacterium]HAP64825.1 EamA family transporter [Cytophagales bacterium]
MLLAIFFFSLMNVFVKLVPDIPSVQVVFFRSVVSLVISYGLLKAQKVSIWGNNKPILILRGLTGAIALILFFTTLQKIPLATAVTLQFLFPIFATIFGVFIVKEKVHPWQWVFFGLSFSGILVINGWEAAFSNLYLILGVSSAVFGGLAYNMVRKLKGTEHPLVIVLYFPLVTLPIAGIWTAVVWVQPQGWEWVYLILVGICTQIAQYFMTKSYQLEEISKVSSLQYTGIVYGLLYGWLFFDEHLGLMAYVGIGLVLLGVVLNVRFKNRLDARVEVQEPKPQKTARSGKRKG